MVWWYLVPTCTGWGSNLGPSVSSVLLVRHLCFRKTKCAVLALGENGVHGSFKLPLEIEETLPTGTWIHVDAFREAKPYWWRLKALTTSKPWANLLAGATLSTGIWRVVVIL